MIGPTGATGVIGPTGATGAPGATGASGAGLRFAMSINGTASTALPRPLYPVAHTGYQGRGVFVSAQGYQIGIDSDGDVAGSPSASYASGDCSGPALIFTELMPAGSLAGSGNANALYYVPRTGATVVTNPTRNSRSTSSVACEPNVSALVGDHYQAPPNNPAVTGIDPLPRPANVLVNFVP